jgi:putative transposase
VVGWSMSARQDGQLVVQAVLMAIWQRPTRTPVILHSDRGCQFTSDEYQQFLAAHQVTCSMSAVGSCADNAAAETFFGRLKRERVNRRQYRTRAEARADIVDYIERWHNPRQRWRLEQQQQGEQLLTQLSVEMG